MLSLYKLLPGSDDAHHCCIVCQIAQSVLGIGPADLRAESQPVATVSMSAHIHHRPIVSRHNPIRIKESA
jgi:hypothetical protein